RDFIGLAMEPIVNQAAKLRYMFGGKAKVPLVIRAQEGAGRGNAAQHSQSLEAWFCHIPGLKVVTPSTPADAKGLLKSAIRDDNPVIFLEHKVLYFSKGAVPEGEYTLPLGVADIKRVVEAAFDYLDAPPLRVCARDVPVPYNATLETAALPQVDDLVAAARALVNKER